MAKINSLTYFITLHTLLHYIPHRIPRVIRNVDKHIGWFHIKLVKFQIEGHLRSSLNWDLVGHTGEYSYAKIKQIPRCQNYRRTTGGFVANTLGQSPAKHGYCFDFCFW